MACHSLPQPTAEHNLHEERARAVPTYQVLTTAESVIADTSRRESKPRITEDERSSLCDQMEGKNSFLTSSLAIRWTAPVQPFQADTQRTVRSYRLISRSFPCFILENFPCPGFLCIWGRAGQSVEYEGAAQRKKKTHQYMSCLSARHAECWESVLCHWLHGEHIHQLGIIFISD